MKTNLVTANNKPTKRQKSELKDPVVKVEGLRTRRSKTSFAAAMELKAKRSTTQVKCSCRSFSYKYFTTSVSFVQLVLSLILCKFIFSLICEIVNFFCYQYFFLLYNKK